jgi:hypothetical protein
VARALRSGAVRRVGVLTTFSSSDALAVAIPSTRKVKAGAAPAAVEATPEPVVEAVAPEPKPAKKSSKKAKKA